MGARVYTGRMSNGKWETFLVVMEFVRYDEQDDPVYHYRAASITGGYLSSAQGANEEALLTDLAATEELTDVHRLF